MQFLFQNSTRNRILRNKQKRQKEGGYIRLRVEAAGSQKDYRRLALASLLISGALLSIFVVSLVEGGQLGPALEIGWMAAFTALISAMCAILALAFNRYTKNVLLPVTAYATLVLTTGVLISHTGGEQSPYIVLWMMVAVFAGLFGVASILLMAVVANIYAAILIIGMMDSQTSGAWWLVLLAANVPLAVGYILRGKKAVTRIVEPKLSPEKAELINNASQAEIVINSIADGVISLDVDGVVRLINPAAQNLLGWPASDARGLHHESVLRLLDKRDHPLPADKNPLEEVKTGRQTIINNDLTLMGRSEKKMLVSLVISPVVEDKQVTSVIVVFRDITTEKAREREQAEFVSTASHEMRTPVAAIEGYLALVANPKTANIDDKARLYLTKAQESVQHLGRLFKDLLTVSRADDGRLEEHPQITDLVGFMGAITESLQGKAEGKNIELQFKPQTNIQSSNLPVYNQVAPIFYANVDRDHFREVAANLVENAIKYTNQGKVVVDVTADENVVKVSIRDSGIGIPAEDIQHLFQKFYRVDNSATREIGGTGLGLYISRRLVENMNGKLWVESEFGSGSTFYISLPRTNKNEIKNIQQSEAIETLQREKIDAVPNTALKKPAANLPVSPKTPPNQAPANPVPASTSKPAQLPPTSPPKPTPATKPAAPAQDNSYRPPWLRATPPSSASRTPPATAPRDLATASAAGPIPNAPEIRNPAPQTPRNPTSGQARAGNEITAGLPKPAAQTRNHTLIVPGR